MERRVWRVERGEVKSGGRGGGGRGWTGWSRGVERVECRGEWKGGGERVEWRGWRVEGVELRVEG